MDRPSWDQKTIIDLLAQESASAPISGGHPMIIFERDIQSILVAEKDAPLRDVIKFERIYTSELEQVNLDYPEDIETLKSLLRVIFKE